MAFHVVFIVLSVFVISCCVHKADLSVACHVVAVSTGHSLPELSGWAVSGMSCHVILLCTQDTDPQNCLAQLSVSCHVILLCTQDTESQNCLAELSVSCHVVSCCCVHRTQTPRTVWLSCQCQCR